jgi:DNA-binding CsgD family transcriptional regulator
MPIPSFAPALARTSAPSPLSATELVARTLRVGMEEPPSASEFREWVIDELRRVIAYGSAVFVDEWHGGPAAVFSGRAPLRVRHLFRQGAAEPLALLERCEREPSALAICSRLCSSVTARGTKVASLHLFRHTGDRPFDLQDHQALAEIMPAVTAAYTAHSHWDGGRLRVVPPASPSPPSRSPTLTRRVRQALDLLLAGKSEKEVADLMGISPHTVHQYVKVLYREHRVRSRSELLVSLLAR